MTTELEYIVRARRDKLAQLRARGIEPFAYGFDRTHHAADAQRVLVEGMEDGPPVRVAGRIAAWRAHGKTVFAHLADASGRVQIYFRRDTLGDDQYSLLELLDLGDILGVEGPLFRTKTGEVTIRVAAFTILAKSLRPLPFGKEEKVDGQIVRHSGFSDTEQRYRQRYADLAVHPEVRTLFLARSRMVTAQRSYLDREGFLEVETPILQPMYGGAFARPFITHHNALDMQLYLRIADELYLKRLVVGGLERVYEIGRDFRNEGIDRSHNPEFTMLEFYESYADYHVMLDRVESLLIVSAKAIAETPGLEADVPSFVTPFPRIEWVPALTRAAGTDVLKASEAEQRRLAERAGVARASELSGPALLDELFQALVEVKLDEPTFVLDYPLALSPLAKPKRGNPALTERFELFACGKELANAFSELNDPDDQRQRFEDQARRRASGDAEAPEPDYDYLRAIEYGMPPMGGCGVGVDRLFMYLTGTHNIRDVILFPTLRPETPDDV